MIFVTLMFIGAIAGLTVWRDGAAAGIAGAIVAGGIVVAAHGPGEPGPVDPLALAAGTAGALAAARGLRWLTRDRLPRHEYGRL